MDTPTAITVTESGTTNGQAYHGTTLECAELIVKQGFKKSVGPDQYFGEGVYFFDGQFDLAKEWPQKRKYPPPWAVIKSRIEYGKLLDLLVPEHITYCEKMRNILKAKGRDVTRATVVNAVSKILNINTVRAAIPRSSTLGNKMRFGLDEPIQLILCVRTESNIKTREIVYTSP